MSMCKAVLQALCYVFSRQRLAMMTPVTASWSNRLTSEDVYKRQIPELVVAVPVGTRTCRSLRANLAR